MLRPFFIGLVCPVYNKAAVLAGNAMANTHPGISGQQGEAGCGHQAGTVVGLPVIP
jgi:hypothetical protein